MALDSATASRRRRPKRVLVVRMLVAKTAWLDGICYWQDGRVVWKHASGTLSPSVSDLSFAQRDLNKIRSYPFASKAALGDPERWLAARLARLELAKQLSGLAGTRFPAQTDRPRGEDVSFARLADLLLAEACCVNPLPISPSTLLAAGGPGAAAALAQWLRKREGYHPARALAALVLGSLQRGAELGRSGAGLPEHCGPGERAAFEWGRGHELPEHPALMAALLHSPDGPTLAHRLLKVLAEAHPLCLPVQTLRELLAAEVPAATVLALAEAAAGAGPLANRLLSRPPLPPQVPREKRRGLAEKRRLAREECTAEVGAFLAECAWHSREPEALRVVVSLLHQTLDLGYVSPAGVNSLVQSLREGLKLPPALLRPWLEFLVRNHARLYSNRPPELCETNPSSPLDGWLASRWCHFARYLLSVLEKTQDPELTQAALDAGLYRLTELLEKATGEEYRCVIALAPDLGLENNPWVARQVHTALRGFPTLREARTIFQRIARLLAPLPPVDRCDLIQSLLYRVADTGGDYRRALPIFTTVAVPLYLRHSLHGEDAASMQHSLAIASLNLTRRLGEPAEAWLDWLFKRAKAALQVWPDTPWASQLALEFGVGLGLAIMGDPQADRDGAFRGFQTVVEALLQHPPLETRDEVLRGTEVIAGLPWLHPALLHLLPQQPQRGLRLAARLGRAQRLDPASLALAPNTLPPGLPGAEWAPTLVDYPDLLPLAERYCRAQRLLGKETGVPPRVREMTELPARLRRELEYLETVLREQPEQKSLQRRADNLRQRLAEGRSARAAAEARERLEQAAAEAELALGEHHATAFFRARLEAIAGPLPPDLALTDDLINAVLLSIEIHTNRRLLLRLLRAHLVGDREWRQRHPANAAFLGRLRERGVDVDAWLGAHPRRVHTRRGTLHFRLEQDPLHILQMGNYFDTCLSVDGCNAFSSVTNACELNKRVLYVQDHAGRVVGRKLIAISAEGSLLGFRTYSSLPDEAANRTLREAVYRYLVDFAARCRLPLADAGEVPRLFAEDWYNDGVMAWNESGDEPVVVSPSSEAQRGNRTSPD